MEQSASFNSDVQRAASQRQRNASRERYEISLTRVGSARLSTRRRANSAREPTNNSHASPTNNTPASPPPSGRKLSYLSPPLSPAEAVAAQEIPARIFTAG